MNAEDRPRLEITDRQGHRIVPARGGSLTAIAVLNERPLAPNRGTSLNLDWLEQVRVNTSAVERRAATLVTRRTVKKDWQIAWLLPRHYLHGPDYSKRRRHRRTRPASLREGTATGPAGCRGEAGNRIT